MCTLIGTMVGLWLKQSPLIQASIAIQRRPLKTSSTVCIVIYRLLMHHCLQLVNNFMWLVALLDCGLGLHSLHLTVSYIIFTSGRWNSYDTKMNQFQVTWKEIHLQCASWMSTESVFPHVLQLHFNSQQPKDMSAVHAGIPVFCLC